MTELRQPRYTEKQKVDIIHAYEAGWTIQSIAKSFVVSVSTIYRIIKKSKQKTTI